MPRDPMSTSQRGGPDPRIVALSMLAALLAPGVGPPGARPPMPPPRVPFPGLPRAAGLARPTAMQAIGRLVAASRAGGPAARRRG